MASARYWRLTGLETYGFRCALTLSEIGLYAAGVRQAITPTATVAPTSGSLANLADASASTTATFADVSQPGFSINWDLGSAVDITEIRFASGSSATEYLYAFTLQYSTDNTTWNAVYGLSRIIYPGANSWSAFVFADDQTFSSNILLLHNDFTDRSPVGRSYSTLDGTPQTSATQSKFNGASIFFDGVGDRINYASSSDFNLGATYTIEAWLYPLALPAAGNYCRFLMFGVNGTGSSLQALTFDSTGALTVSPALGGQQGITTAAGTIVINQWNHYAISVLNGFGIFFKNGKYVASGPITTQTAGNVGLAIGYDTVATVNFNYYGYACDIRIKKGEAAYLAEFDPPVAAFPNVGSGNTFASRLFNFARSASRFTGPTVGNVLQSTNLPKTCTIFDNSNGTGIITSTVKEKASPANMPLARKVRLFRERDGKCVRETWSDATTGIYTFTGLDLTQTYTAVSWDHTKTYRAVAADGLIATR